MSLQCLTSVGASLTMMCPSISTSTCSHKTIISNPFKKKGPSTMTVAEEPQKYCITFDNVLQAAERIKGVAHRTAVLTSRSLITNGNKNDQQPQYFFKVEAMQKTGSFKFRGALNAVKAELEKLTNSNDSDTFPPPQPLSVVTHSSGNHAQALALASKLASTPSRPITATIVMPLNTPTVKKAAVADFGGQIVMVASTNEAREEEADRIVATTGAAFIHPSEDPRVIAGQGTVCLEFVEQVKELRKMSMVGDLSSGMAGVLDAVIIPVGGGGLAAGNVITLRALLGDSVKIILAEPAVLDDAKRSFTGQRLLGHRPDNTLDSVADGLKTTLGPNTWPIVRDLVDDIMTVSESEILRATKLVWERLKVCIEPSAGVGVAVAMGEEFQSKYNVTSGVHNIGIILCGGNVDVIQIAKKMQEFGI